MNAAEYLAALFHAVTDDPAIAMLTGRRERVDRTFETIEDMLLSARRDLESLVVIVPANFASSHFFSLRIGLSQ
jgi:hypothetical protein